VLRHAPLPVFVGGGLSAADLSAAQSVGAHGIALPLADWLHRPAITKGLIGSE
jgi:hypothetical protein